MSLFNYRYLEANVADVNLVDLHRVKNIKCIPTRIYVRTYLFINFVDNLSCTFLQSNIQL